MAVAFESPSREQPPCPQTTMGYFSSPPRSAGRRMIPSLIPGSEFVSMATSWGPEPAPGAPALSDGVQVPASAAPPELAAPPEPAAPPVLDVPPAGASPPLPFAGAPPDCVVPPELAPPEAPCAPPLAAGWLSGPGALEQARAASAHADSPSLTNVAFLMRGDCELFLSRWLHESGAAGIARETLCPCGCFPPSSRDFPPRPIGRRLATLFGIP